MFDNMYIGHSLEDAKKLAEETFEIKKKIEQEAKKAEEKAEAEEAGDIHTTFKDDPVGFVREKVFEFVELAKIDPVFAARAKPEVAAGLGFVALFFIGALFSLISGGSPPKPAAVSFTFCPSSSSQKSLSFLSHQPSKKTDAPTPDDKTKSDTAPVSKAGDDKKTDTPVRNDTPVKKRK